MTKQDIESLCDVLLKLQASEISLSYQVAIGKAISLIRDNVKPTSILMSEFHSKNIENDEYIES